MKVNSMKKAAVLNMSSKYIVIIIQLLYTAILSRILSPEDYGIVAIINVFVNFFNILSDMGMGSAIIQHQNLSKKEINSIYTVSCMISLLLALFFILLSMPISIFYNDNIYLRLGPLLSVSVLFNTLNTVPNALLMKEKKFVRVAVRQIIIATLCSAFSIITALIGWKYYSLIIYSVMTAVLTFFWNIKGSSLKITGQLDIPGIKKIASYSFNLFGFNIINYFSRNLDNLLIGKFLGKTELGNYNKAYQLMLYPTNNFARVITPVLHPFLADKQGEKEYLYISFIKTVKIFSLIGVFTQSFCFFASEELVLILYGNNWKGIILCFKILSLSIWSQMICTASGAYFQVLNKTDNQLRRGVFNTIVMILAIATGINFHSIVIVSLCVMVAYNLNFISMLYYLIYKSFEKNIIHFLHFFLPDCIIGAGVFISLLLISQILINNILLSFAIKLLASGITFLIFLVATKQSDYFIYLLPNKVVSKLPIKQKKE